MGSLGAAVGCILAVFFGATSYALAIGTVVGSTIGSLIGYRIGETIQKSESIGRAEQFVSTSEKLEVFTGWAFVICGVTVLLIVGWDLRIFLATAFFALGSVYLTYYR